MLHFYIIHPFKQLVNLDGSINLPDEEVCGVETNGAGQQPESDAH